MTIGMKTCKLSQRRARIFILPEYGYAKIAVFRLLFSGGSVYFDYFSID